MSAALPEFFSQMHEFLTGARTVAQVNDALGPSPSGDENLVFYRVLARRNLFKILGEIFSPLRTLVQREDEALWTALVREYLASEVPVARHPHGVGAAFPAFVAARRDREPSQPALWEEVADYCWLRLYVGSVPDDGTDGFDQRLHVRQYTHRITQVIAQLEHNSAEELPEPSAELVLIYRHWATLHTRFFHPSAAGLVALAVRQGAPIPEVFAAIPDEHIAIAQQQLVDHGVLRPAQGTS